MSIATKRHVARKFHRCGGCTKGIEPGWVYLAHTIFPSSDISGRDVPYVSNECATCACRYGRDHLLGSIPEEQRDEGYMYWLGDERPQPPDPLDGAA